MIKQSILSLFNLGTRHVAERIDRVRCSFCGRGRDSVRRLVSGPSVYICDVCVQKAADIIAESDNPKGTPPLPA